MAATVAIPTAQRRRVPRARTVITAVLALIVLILLVYPQLFVTGEAYEVSVQDRFQPPSWEHIFGTDEAGRDIFSRMILGARTSLGSSLAVVVIAAGAGVIIGSIGGWFGGWLDRILSKTTDIFLAFPYLVLAMAIAAAVGRGTTSAVVALAIVWWPSYARMVRTLVRTQRSDLSVIAARTLGASTGQLLRWHVIPHSYAHLLVRMTLDVGYVLIAFTGLSFLGLGTQPPSAEWGLLIATAKTYALSAWWYPLFPGIVILATVSACVWIGDGFTNGNGARRRVA